MNFHELNDLPEQMQREVCDFARFLRLGDEEDEFNGLVHSVSALERDWTTPEEEAAWSSL